MRGRRYLVREGGLPLSMTQGPRVQYSLPGLARVLDSKGLLPEELAERVGYPLDVVYEILDGRMTPASSCHRIAAAVGSTIQDLGAKSGRTFSQELSAVRNPGPLPPTQEG